MTRLADISSTRELLFARLETLEHKHDILKAPEMKALLSAIKEIEPAERAAYGKAVNQLHADLRAAVEATKLYAETLPPIDVTAPFDANQALPALLPVDKGSIHPLMQEIAVLAGIFERMGFSVEESREIDDQYHMFETLNFPKDHPARDDYDTFMTTETDGEGDPYIAPAHTSTMQNRVLRKYAANLASGEPIAAVVPDRVFRNEDLDS